MDSRILLNIIVKNGTTAKRRLQILVCMQRESIKRGDLKRTGWILGNKNGADVLTEKHFRKHCYVALHEE